MTTTFKQVLLLSCLALCATTPIHQASANDDNGNSINGLERFLQNELLTKQIGAATSASSGGAAATTCQKDALYKYMDNLAIILKDAISNRSNGKQMLAELLEAINMVDLLKVAGTSAGKMVSLETKPTKYNNFQAPSRGLADALEGPQSRSEHIVQSEKKLSEEALKELEEFAKGGSISTEKFIQFYSDPRWNKLAQANSNNNNHSVKIQAVKDFLIRGFDTGANLMDQLYLSTTFIEQLPIIGSEISKLKEKGQIVYDLIKTVRSLKTFIELYRSGQDFDVKFSDEGKKMLGNAGIDALKYVAIKMLKARMGIDLNPGNINEIAGRTAYYLLIQFAPHSNKINCLKN